MVQEMNSKTPETATPETVAPPPRLTYEEFLDWADDERHAEWVNGEVIFMGTVSGEHNRVGLFLLAILRIWVEVKGAGELRYEPFQMKTAPHLAGRSPDVFFVATENLGRLKKNYLDGAADLVIEIISPESRVRDRKEKFCEYEEGGVKEYWLLDPVRRQAEFYHRAEDGRYAAMAIDEQGVFRSRVLDGLWIRVEWLWQEPPPAVLRVVGEWQLI